MRLRLVLMFLLFSRVALADMIPPMPPMTCAKGSSPTNSHNGAYCNPNNCTSNTDCETGKVCQLQGLCISFSTYYARSGGQFVRDSAGDACSAKKACSYGECEVVMRCVPKGTKATAGPENRLTPPDPNAPTKTPEPDKLPDPLPDPKTPETQPEPPDSQPDATPDSTPTKVNPPTKVEKGRCSASPTDELSASFVGLFLAFALFTRRRSNQSVR
jgi:hypothetical protein